MNLYLVLSCVHGKLFNNSIEIFVRSILCGTEKCINNTQIDYSRNNVYLFANNILEQFASELVP